MVDQIFVRFVPTWEVDPEPTIVKEPSLEEKEALYDRLLSEATNIEAGPWEVETGKFFTFQDSVLIVRAVGKYHNLFKIDKSFCRYFPSGELMDLKNFQRSELFSCWVNWRSVENKGYLSCENVISFTQGNLYPNHSFQLRTYQ